MKILLDTDILLWTTFMSEVLPEEIAEFISDPENDVWLSVASIWEIAIKARRNRKDFSYSPLAILAAGRAMGFEVLAIKPETAAMVSELPPYHRDPFDRLMIAQALAGPFRFFTADAALIEYSELVTLVRRN